jgi:hypothetical protein
VTKPKGLKSDASMTLQADFSGVIELIAAGNAMTGSIKDKRYLDLVTDVAWGLADREFNREAAAYAAAGGGIKHMFEWGTLGINRGRSSMRPDPLSPNARLWETFATGHGLDRYMTFVFKPSVATVPKPTASETGMDPEVINQMRDQVFRWKAKVFELGETVTIAPKRSKFLLIPAYPQNRPYMRPNDVKRGYMLLQRPIQAQPGRNVAGNFESYWFDFWEGRGGVMVDKSIQDQYEEDYMTPILLAERTSGKSKPLYATSIQGQILKRAKQIQNKARSNAALRKARNKA